MEFRMEVTGTSPLLMANPQMVDPLNEIVREKKPLTSKRRKTDADLERIDLLDWIGGLYVEDGVVFQPTAKIRKSLIEAGTITKDGTRVRRAVAFDEATVPLEYPGCDGDPLKLVDDPAHVSRLRVKRGVMQVRPKFDEWSMTLTGLLIEDAGLNFDDLQRIASLAGRAIGIGDNRVNGYGRYEAEVEVAS